MYSMYEEVEMNCVPVGPRRLRLTLRLTSDLLQLLSPYIGFHLSLQCSMCIKCHSYVYIHT